LRIDLETPSEPVAAASDHNQSGRLQPMRLALTMRPMKLRRDTLWLLAALFFGLFVLPFLVHATGLRVLGPYAGGTAGAFLADYFSSLATLRWHAWTLALGPPLLVICWRLTGRLMFTSRD
jgi:hypothetical protein